MIDAKSKLAAITSEELIKLIENSKAVKKMTAEKKAEMLETAKNPASPEARIIFDALTEEAMMMARIETNFNKIVKEAVDDFEVGIAEVKHDTKKIKL